MGRKQPRRKAGSRAMLQQAEGAAAGAAGEGGRGVRGGCRRTWRGGGAAFASRMVPAGRAWALPGARPRPREEVGRRRAGWRESPQAPVPTHRRFHPDRKLRPEVVPGLQWRPDCLLSDSPLASVLFAQICQFRRMGRFKLKYLLRLRIILALCKHRNAPELSTKVICSSSSHNLEYILSTFQSQLF